MKYPFSDRPKSLVYKDLSADEFYCWSQRGNNSEPSNKLLVVFSTQIYLVVFTDAWGLREQKTRMELDRSSWAMLI